jgi:hypothetical protein
MTQLQIVKSLARLQCTECGAEANASCNCGQPYLPKEIAKQPIRANPQKSNRAIAEETGVSEPTVRRARASGASPDAPETVVGLDGKTYKAKGKAPDPKAIAAPPPTTESDDSGVFDFDKLKRQVAELAQRFTHLTPAQAREIESLVEPLSDIVFEIINADDRRKGLTKEAKNPQKALDDARKLEQRHEMDDDRADAIDVAEVHTESDALINAAFAEQAKQREGRRRRNRRHVQEAAMIVDRISWKNSGFLQQ